MLGRFFALALCSATLTFAGTVPRPSPDFAVNFNNGGQMRLNQFQGKVVVLACILTTCPHCQFTIQTLSKLQNEYGPRGLQVIGSAIEDMAAMNLPDFVRRFQPPFPVGSNVRNDAQNYLQHPVMFRLLMPQVVIIDRKGNIRTQLAGDDKFFEKPVQENNFREVLEPLLKEGGAQVAHGKGAKQ